jgi:hypothetical protein
MSTELSNGSFLWVISGKIMVILMSTGLTTSFLFSFLINKEEEKRSSG